MKQEVPVTLKAIVPTQAGCGIFLTDGVKVVAIFVDHAVAGAITIAMHGVTTPRPMTHELMNNILVGLGVVLQKVVINDLKEETFFARLFLHQPLENGRNMLEIDSRPSDAIALALQMKAPILMTQDVLERAADMKWALEQSDGGDDIT